MTAFPRYFFTLIFALMLASPVFAQSPNEKIEIMKTDITSVQNFNAEMVTVYGVSLGMLQHEALEILRKNDNLFVKIDNYNEYRVYVYDKNEEGERNEPILYYIWEKGATGLKMITFFTPSVEYLVGNTKDLLSLQTLDSNSGICKEFLGKCNYQKVTLDIPSIEMKHTAFYFVERGLKVTKRTDEGTSDVVFCIYRDDLSTSMK
ncbi:MAG: hypothetical protein WD077_04235 [Bacteroidia bacterium]